MTITCIACFVSTPFVVAAAIFFSKNAYIAIVLFSLVGFIAMAMLFFDLNLFDFDAERGAIIRRSKFHGVSQQ